MKKNTYIIILSKLWTPNRQNLINMDDLHCLYY